MALHEDQREANRICLQSFNTGVKLGIVDGTIAPLTTVAGYKAAVTALAVHEDQRYALVRINKAADASKTLGLYTDGAGGTIDLANDVAGMRAIHVNAVAPALAPADQYGGVLMGE
jgi:hypothetical protein